MDLNYQVESKHPFGKQRADDPVEFNPDLYGWYRKLIAVRTETKLEQSSRQVESAYPGGQHFVVIGQNKINL